MDMTSLGVVKAPYATALSLFLALVTGEYRPDPRWHKTQWRLKYAARALLHPRLTLQWLDYLLNGSNPALLKHVHHNYYCKSQRPYLCADNTPSQTVKALTQHLEFVKQLPRHFQHLLYCPQSCGTQLVNFQGKTGNYSLRLVSLHEMDKEGELSLQLLCANDLLAQITFSVVNRKGEWCLFIGGIQGPRAHTSHEVIQRATRDCHSLFPKRILLEGILALSQRLGIAQVISVSNETHIYQHWRYRRKKRAVFLADYNGFLLALGGELQPDGNIALPLSIARKKESEIPSRKRAEYRRRYALLDTLLMRIDEVM